MKYRIRIDRDFSREDGWSIWIIGYDLRSNKTFFAKPISLEFVRSDDGGWRLPDPTIQINGPDADGMVEALIGAINECSFIKHKSKGDGEIEAVKGHLKDMREIAMKFIEFQTIPRVTQ